MATTGHESELISVSGLKASLQSLKTNMIDTKSPTSSTVSTISYSGGKLQKTINGSTTDVVAASTIVSNGGGITSHQTVKEDGVTGATVNRYASCTTAAATAAKTASITSGTPTLEAGLYVIVKFTNANTADNPTLNINSTGAKNIYTNGEQITTDDSKKGLLKNICKFVYDGTNWVLK